MDPLMMIHKSLTETGFGSAADGALSDTIRRLASFGLTLMQLDIRQESTRHTEALTAITTHLGLGTYSDWDETKRREWLSSELSSKRPLLPRGRSLKSMGFSATALDTLRTFELAAQLGPESLGAYVISQCQQASDVMAVMLLQQDAGVRPGLRVVPLFETLEDLENSPATVEALFSIEAYTTRIQGKQEIMVGYSDSAKDAGRLAASWAQYNAQVHICVYMDVCICK
jgi:phosphoenolpyruvate carboxylase